MPFQYPSSFDAVPVVGHFSSFKGNKLHSAKCWVILQLQHKLLSTFIAGHCKDQLYTNILVARPLNTLKMTMSNIYSNSWKLVNLFTLGSIPAVGGRLSATHHLPLNNRPLSATECHHYQSLVPYIQTLTWLNAILFLTILKSCSMYQSLWQQYWTSFCYSLGHNVTTAGHIPP